MLFNVKSVVIFNAKKEEIGSVSGEDAIRLMLKDFAEKGEGKVFVFVGFAGKKVSLAISHNGYLQIEYPPC